MPRLFRRQPVRLQSALEGIHPVRRTTANRVPLELAEENCARLKNLCLDTDIGRLDCLGNVLGLGDFHSVKQQSETIEIDGHPCRILRIEALIASKKAMGRPKDIETIQQLEVIRQERPQGQPERCTVARGFFSLPAVRAPP